MSLPVMLFGALFLMELFIASRNYVVDKCKTLRRRNYERLNLEPEEEANTPLIRTEEQIDGPILAFPVVGRVWGLRAVHILLFVMYACYYELSTSVLEMLRCPRDTLPKTISDTWLEGAPWLSCSSALYTPIWITAWVFFAVYVCGIPLIFGAVLFRHYRRFGKSGEALEWYAFLMENYTPECFYFEMIWVLRRIMISVAMAFIPHTSSFKTLAVSFCLLLVLLVQAKLKPFRQPLENLLDLTASCVILLTFVMAQLRDAIQGYNGQCQINNLQWFCSWGDEKGLEWLMFGTNALLVVVFIALFLYQVGVKIRASRLLKKKSRELSDAALALTNSETNDII